MSLSVALLILLSYLTSNVEPIPVNRTHYEQVLDTEQTIRGPIGTLLNDILLRVQQHDQEQRLDAIQQVQQRQLVQGQLQRQVDGQRDNVEQLKHLQMNFTGEIEHLVEELHEIQRNLTLELRHQQVQPSLSIPVGGTILGCFNDASERDLPHEVITSENMTHQMCVTHCFEKGYKFAGTQDARRCYCGNSYGRYGDTLNGCNRVCHGDHSGLTLCGGVLANTVIRIGGSLRGRETHNRPSILMQQHYGGTNTFFGKTWAEFKSEFGHVDGNYWIGNERLHHLTKDGQYRLRVDLLAKSNNHWYWAEYGNFTVGDEASGYILSVGGYMGTAGDSLAVVNGMKFSTKDKDNDIWSAAACATHTSHGNGAGFWYGECGHAHNNSPPGTTTGFTWYNLPMGLDWSDRKLLVSRMTLVPKMFSSQVEH